MITFIPAGWLSSWPVAASAETTHRRPRLWILNAEPVRAPSGVARGCRGCGNSALLLPDAPPGMRLIALGGNHDPSAGRPTPRKLAIAADGAEDERINDPLTQSDVEAPRASFTSQPSANQPQRRIPGEFP